MKKMDKFTDLVKKLANETKVQLRELCTSKGTDFVNARDEFIQLFLEEDGVEIGDKQKASLVKLDDVVQKSGVVDGVKGNEDGGVINMDDIDKLKSDDVSDKASLVKKDDVVLKLGLTYATELDKWDPADFQYPFQNPLSVIDHNQLKELDHKSEPALLVDFTQPTMQELGAQVQIPGERKGVDVLAIKLLIDKEASGGHFLVKADYLKNVTKLVKYGQKIIFCEKDGSTVYCAVSQKYEVKLFVFQRGWSQKLLPEEGCSSQRPSRARISRGNFLYSIL
ncbi:hypothetical protein IFM89_024728 [Coptis chinensis]|uniref:Uncharacterized protein n=1 Tax=Coptis chinensis TaxID=261450 RepID=A0A835LJA5_9MAGN|nr:hypothetical protein IFM89_024728 [Coptis chinensis]